MRFLVIAPETSMNSLGRALSVMEVLCRVGEARLAAYDTGPLWTGAEGARFEVGRFNSYEELSGIVRRLDRPANGPLAIVAVKPFPRTLGWAERLRDELGGSIRLIADIDDADVSIQRASRRRQSPLWRLRMAFGTDRDPDLHTPRNIRRTLRNSLVRADALVLSSWALRTEIPAFGGPVLRMPHPRPRQEYLQPTPSDRLRLGFLGTPRGHKGLDRLLAVLVARPDAELHALEGTLPPGVRDAHGQQLVVHPLLGADTLSRAYADVDVVVLPQDASAVGGRLQLPAKLFDAQRFGRPVIATATPPIIELGGPGLIPVEAWKDLGEGLAALDSLADAGVRERLGRAANRHFNETVSAESQAKALGPSFAEVMGLPPESPARQSAYATCVD